MIVCHLTTPPLPRYAAQLFQKEQRPKVKAANPESTAAADITKLLSEAWKAASATVKAPYEAKAKVGPALADSRKIFSGQNVLKMRTVVMTLYHPIEGAAPCRLIRGRWR